MDEVVIRLESLGLQMILKADEKGLCYAKPYKGKDKGEDKGKEKGEGDNSQTQNPHLKAAISWFEDYQHKKPARLPKLNPTGTSFQKRVWQELLKIKTTATYKQIAERIGNAPRAVGQAAGKNPLSIIVPCHRLVAVNGLGGYAGGLLLKAKLLKHEQRLATD